jgi:hypothetical protein
MLVVSRHAIVCARLGVGGLLHIIVGFLYPYAALLVTTWIRQQTERFVFLRQQPKWYGVGEAEVQLCWAQQGTVQQALSSCPSGC